MAQWTLKKETPAILNFPLTESSFLQDFVLSASKSIHVNFPNV